MAAKQAQQWIVEKIHFLMPFDTARASQRKVEVNAYMGRKNLSRQWNVRQIETRVIQPKFPEISTDRQDKKDEEVKTSDFQ